MKLIFVILILFGSAYAAKTSHSEVVSFMNDDKHFICKGRDAKWFFPNGTLIRESTNKFKIEKLSNDESVLSIKNIDAWSIGNYKCVSSLDDLEEIFSLQLYFPLTVNYSPLTIVKENDDAILKCKSVSVPKVEKQIWFHGERELTPMVDYEKSNGAIVLKNVKADQGGKYTCISIQKVEKVRSIQEREMELVVEHAPVQIQNEASEIYANIGDSVTLTCDGKSVPLPRFSWLQNGFETYKNIEIRDSSSTLKVDITSEDQFGTTYYCIAENIHGRSNQSYVLKEALTSDDSTSVAAKFTAVASTIILFFTTAILTF